MNRELFCEIGACLYGPAWQSEMARQIGVSDRTVRRWISGDRKIPDSVKDDLRRLLKKQEKDLTKLISALDRD